MLGADISGLRQGLKNAQKDVKYFGRNVTGSMKEIRGQVAGTAAAIGAGLAISSGVQDAMRYEALMTTLGETMGASRKDFEKWQETVGSAIGFSRLQAADLANQMSLNFKKIASDQADLVKKTTTMMEAAALISNKRGMSMAEVSDRIRSAMNGEADAAHELGVNVLQSAVQQSEAYRMLSEGQPYDKLSDKTRQTILYQHILAQVSENLGTTMQETTALRMAQFTAALADVKLALGQAFLPIVYNVLPLLTKMAQALYRVLTVVAAFMRSLFGGFKFKTPVSKGDVKTTQEQAKALGGVGEAAKSAGGATEKAGKKSQKAAKKAKDAWKGFLAGFDEVNTIPDKDTGADAAGAGAGAGAGGGGGGGIGDLAGGLDDAMPDFGSSFEESLSGMASAFDKYTKPIRTMFKKMWAELSGYFKIVSSEISAWWKEHGDTIKQALKTVLSVVGPTIKSIVKFIWESVKTVINGVLDIFMGITTFLAGVFTGDFKTAWEGIKQFFAGIIQVMFGIWNLTFIGGLRKLLVNFVKDGIKSLKSFMDEIKKAWDGGLKTVKTYWDRLYTGIKTVLSDMKRFIDGRVELYQTSFGKFFGKIKEGARDAVEGMKKAFLVIGSWIGRNVVSPVVSEMERIKDAFSKGVGEGFKYLINRAIDGFNNALAGFNALKNATPFGDKIPNLKLPRLAQGGITNGPTLAMIGDNAGGREVVSPLDKLQGMLTTSVVQAMQMTQGGRTGGDIVLNIDGRSFARVVKPFLDNEAGRVGSDVRIRTY